MCWSSRMIRPFAAYRRLLHDAGYQVAEATNGLEAIERLQRGRPHLIVLDLMLPRLGGWQFLERRARCSTRTTSPSSCSRGSMGGATSGDAWRGGLVHQAAGRTALPGRSRAPDGHPRRRGRYIGRGRCWWSRTSASPQPDRVPRSEGYAPGGGTIDEARRRIVEERPDLILLDLMLPSEDGWQFLRCGEKPELAASVLVISAAPHRACWMPGTWRRRV